MDPVNDADRRNGIPHDAEANGSRNVTNENIS
jgi:hypothetical protein